MKQTDIWDRNSNRNLKEDVSEGISFSVGQMSVGGQAKKIFTFNQLDEKKAVSTNLGITALILQP